MGFSLPYPTVPTNGQTLDATPLLANIVALAQAIASFDGSQIQNVSVLAAAFNANINPNTLLKETTVPFVASGLVWSAITGLTAGMTSGVLYYNGIRTPVNSVSSNTFVASKDTYVDIDVNGNVAYPNTTNGGSAPALTTNSIRVAKVVTSGSAVTSVVQTGVESNNVQIYPNNATLPLNWISWTPTFTNVSGGTLNYAKYIQIGKTIHFRLRYTLAGAGVSGGIIFSTPTTINADLSVAITDTINGTSMLAHSGNWFPATISWASSTTLEVFALNAAGTFTTLATTSSTVPFTWASTDVIVITGTYDTP